MAAARVVEVAHLLIGIGALALARRLGARSEHLGPPRGVTAALQAIAGDLDAAITHYFATVGRRWDEEWLVTAAITAHSG
jgi:hypothetical protein